MSKNFLVTQGKNGKVVHAVRIIKGERLLSGYVTRPQEVLLCKKASDTSAHRNLWAAKDATRPTCKRCAAL